MKKNMKIFSLLFLLSFMIGCKKDVSQPFIKGGNPVGLIDTRGLDRYINIAQRLSNQQEPSQQEWDSLFVTPFYHLFIYQYKYSTPDEQKNELRVVYKSQNYTSEQLAKYAHHFEYKKRLDSLQAYSNNIKNGLIREELKKYLFPYLPKRLQNMEVPPVVYTYYFGEEANGLENMILQDALLAFKVDNYAKGVLTAHEAFHSIATKSLISRYQVKLKSTDVRSIITESLIGISQEGIADLIDKEILGKVGSPVYDVFQTFTVNEEEKSINFIKNLDKELIRISQNPFISDLKAFKQSIMAYAGHQPGRYMGKAIKITGQLNDLITDIENPFAFIYAYNKAANQLKGNYPVFSNESLNYLKSIEQQIIKPLN
ncbi:hypothetical protein AD998_11350 [bacterium 336/3]|nr:hypothetical protein AD998_11350 [bacterium 336/3]